MTIITQAIETKYLRGTNVRGPRIKATALAGSLSVEANSSGGIVADIASSALALKVKTSSSDGSSRNTF